MRDPKIGRAEQDRNLDRDASAAFDLPLTECRFRYVVCSTQRTGSSLVCRALRDTEKAGQPMEFFHPRLIKAFLARFGRDQIATEAYVDFIESHRSTGNGVFGLKVHLDQLIGVMKDITKRKIFLSRFDRVILISRRNKLAQAISYARARQTQHWEADRPELADRARRSSSQYDFSLIAKLLGLLVGDDQKWRNIISGCHVPCHVLTYEELVDDFPRTMADIARFLAIEGLDGSAFLTPPLLKMGDEINVDWERRFVAEVQGNAGFEATH